MRVTDYNDFYQSVMGGDQVQPRGLNAVAVQNTSFTYFPLTFWRREKDNPAIGLVEMLHLISGSFDVEDIERVAPNAELQLFSHQSAYGLRTIHAFNAVVRELLKDKYSRRAVVLIAKDSDYPETMPCTISMQFQLVDAEMPMYPYLASTTTMRSSDIVWGLPYDMIQFGGVTFAVASCMGWLPYYSVINAANSHVYEDHAVHGKWSPWTFFIPKLGEWCDYEDWAVSILEKKLSRKDLYTQFELKEGFYAGKRN